jgi:uncharacterized membrane-anchored protein YitT (DUF2179 family)
MIMPVLIVIYTFSSLLLVGLSIPMIKEKVEPNGIYGFRIPLTINHPEIWYPVNRRAGWCLLVIAILTFSAAILLPFVPKMTLDIYAIVITVIVFGGMMITLIAGVGYARQLARHLPEK